MPVAEGREYLDAARFDAGANGRLSRYPFGAVAGPDGGMALGIDMAYPGILPRRVQRRDAGALPGLRHRPDAREAGRSSAVLQIPLRRRVGISRGSGPILRAVPGAVRLPHSASGSLDAVRQDQRRQRLAGFRLPVQGRRQRDRLGRSARHPHVPLHGADDLVDVHEGGNGPQSGGGPGRGEAACRGAQGPASPGPVHQRLSR